MPKNIPKEVYESFSFQEGSQPNYERLLSCFIVEGLFINNKGENPMVKPLKDYVAFIKSNVEAGNILSIKESEIENSVTLFGKVGHIVSRYQLEAKTRGGMQTRYGVNLFQIIKFGTKWKISSMCWDDHEDQRLFEVDMNKENA
jgi:hypothetical protein